MSDTRNLVPEMVQDMPHDEFVKRRCDWDPEAFEAFWAAYPLKLNKVAAMRTWDRLRLPESEIPELMAFLKMYKYHEWCLAIRECTEFDRRRDPEKGHRCEYYDGCVYYYANNCEIVFAERFLFDQPWIR